ncbi:MAG: slipin family protein [Brevinematales bacterium]|nr:slipin family protein [Brevinematales bacterium]
MEWLVITIAAIFLIILLSSLKIIREYERLVVFRFGRFFKVKGPGFVVIIPGVDQVTKIATRTVTMDVPPQDVITRDNVSVSVNAVVYFRVIFPEKAIIEVQDFQYATSQMAQTILRSVVGEFDLDGLLSQRESINEKLEVLLDLATDPWGIKVSAVEIKHVDLPEEMKRAMARQAEAERERRAKIIAASGELEASQKLLEAAQKMALEPVTIQLRYLQTLNEISAENATTIVFPIPIDMFKIFQK